MKKTIEVFPVDNSKVSTSKNEVIFVSGKRGSGKTYWTEQYLEKIPRALIYDTLGDYEFEYTFYDIDSLIDFLIADKADPKFFSASLDTWDNAQFPFFCRAALACNDLYVVIEEIDLFSTPTNTPPELLKLLKYGRHWNLQIIGISRRPAEVSRNFTAAATRFVIFNQHEPRDIQYFRSIIGIHADKIPQLEEHCYFDIQLKNPSYVVQNPLP